VLDLKDSFVENDKENLQKDDGRCPFCNYELKIDSRYCPNCKKELKNYDETYRKKVMKKLFFGSIFTGMTLIVMSYILTLQDFNEFMDYVYLVYFLIALFMFALIFLALISLARKKQTAVGAGKNYENSIQKKEFFDNSEKILDEIKYLSLGPSNMRYNLYFTNRRMIVFSLGEIKAFKLKTLEKKQEQINSEIEKFKDDLNKIINFNANTFSILYSDIISVNTKKRIISFDFYRYFKNEKKKSSLAFSFVSYKNRIKTAQFLPILNKHFPLKVTINNKRIFN